MSKNKQVDLIHKSYYTNKKEVCDNNNECINIYINSSKLKNYSDFKKYLVQKWVSKPSRDSEFASQGLCHIGDYTLITSYDTSDRKFFLINDFYELLGKDDADNINRSSRLDIVDIEGRVKTLELGNKAHVGGIGYHEESGKIFISNEGKVNIYDENVIAKASDRSVVEANDSFSIPKEIGLSDYLVVKNNNLFVGNFYEDKNGKLAKYNLDKKGNVIGDPKIYDVPFKKVQGMEIFEKDGKEYYLFSTSYGRRNDSNLIIATLENGNFKEFGRMKLPSMSEQISLDKDGNLGVVFESDCNYYKGATKEIGNVCYIDIEAKINDLEKEYNKNNNIKNDFDKLFDKDQEAKNAFLFIGKAIGEQTADIIKNIKENNDEIEL